MAKPETSPELTIESYTPAPTRPWGYQQLAWAVALLGVGIRVEQYLHNRSLWLDEAMVGLNLIHRSFGQLTQPLEFHVVEPIAWLFTAKVCNLLFGPGEKALRFPVLAAGVIAVALVLLLG
ncbi:MAG TPA: hypothetical protein VLC12_08855, partial [Terriglobales bacterium]|nr:hypothetical protein [Terriglobales bacterium]